MIHKVFRLGLAESVEQRQAYHRFVKTTPNPRATKNSSGELVGPLLPPLSLLPVGVGDPLAAADVVDDMADGRVSLLGRVVQRQKRQRLSQEPRQGVKRRAMVGVDGLCRLTRGSDS